MRNLLADLGGSFKGVWGSMNQGQRVIALLLLVVLVGGLITLFMYSSKPDYVLLYRSFSPEESGALVDKLEELGISYRLSDGGTRIEVPRDKVYLARMKLAQEGFPQSGVGFELFDKNTFGLTSFLQKVNYQRALQGELERTIAQLEEVDGARVHITLPEESLFAEEEKLPTASVVLKVRPGTRLRENQIEAIARLVANSVEGLDASRVTILDDQGNVLASGSGEESWGSIANLTANQLEMKKELESVINQRVQSMLEGVLGRRKAVVRASVELNLEQKEGEKEIYQPVAGNEGVIRSTQEEEEKYQGTSDTAGGVPGVASNIPVYGSEEERQGGSYTRRNVTTNYEINRVLEKYAALPGDIKRLSVAVLVDSVLSPEEVEKIRRVVEVAAGIDPERGDAVVVETLPFNQDFWQEEERALKAQRFMELIDLVGRYGIPALLILVLYFIGRKVLVAVIAPREVVAEVYEEEPLEYEEATEVAPLRRAAELSPEEKMRMEIQKRMEEEIKKLVEEKPDDAVKLIRNWLSEE